MNPAILFMFLDWYSLIGYLQCLFGSVMAQITVMRVYLTIQ